jgi:hypothetical protein
VLTRQYEERGTLLAKSKVGRNPENPRFSWLLPEELDLELIQNPNDTEASAAGSSIRACVARKSKTQRGECLEGRKHNTSIPSKVETVHQIILKPDLGRFFS